MKSATKDKDAKTYWELPTKDSKKTQVFLKWEESRPNIIAMIEKFRDDVYKVFQEQGAPIDGIVIEKTGESFHGDKVIQITNGKAFYYTDLRSIAHLSRNPEFLEGVAIHEATHIKQYDSLIQQSMAPVYRAQGILKELVEFHKSDPKAFCNYLKSDSEWYANFAADIHEASQILKPALVFMKKNGIGSLSDEELHKKVKEDPKLRFKMGHLMAEVAIKIEENRLLFQSLEDIHSSLYYKFDQHDEKHEALIRKVIKSLEPALRNTGDFNTIKRAAEYRADEAILNGKDPSSFIKYLRKNDEYYAKRNLDEGFATTHPLRKDRISRLERLLAERNEKPARRLRQ